MGPGILKVEEMNRLGVISLLFTEDFLEDTHVALGESPSSRGGRGIETVEARSFHAM